MTATANPKPPNGINQNKIWPIEAPFSRTCVYQEKRETYQYVYIYIHKTHTVHCIQSRSKLISSFVFTVSFSSWWVRTIFTTMGTRSRGLNYGGLNYRLPL